METMDNSFCPQCARHDPAMAHPSLFDVPTACQILSISKSTFYLLVKDGRLPVFKLGNKTLVTSLALRDFVQVAHEQSISGQDV
jgi:excisionase family DNA binding protein